MNSLEIFKKQYKRSVLVRILAGLKHGTWSRAESKSFAKVLLVIWEAESEKKFFSDLSKLSRTREDVLDIFINLFAEYENEFRKNSLSTVRSSIMMIGKGGEN